MKIGILSDIHANAAALDAVFSSPVFGDVEVLLVAGDFIGYYFDAKYVLDKIRSFQKPTYCVRGNHEDMLLKAMVYPDQLQKVSLKYGPGISIALEQLTDSDLKWISGLPHPFHVNDLSCSILLCHGSPYSIDEYIYPDTSLEGLLVNLDDKPDVIIMGHTHYPFVREVGNCLIINPGSVGQPRNRIPGAHWALLDTSRMNVSLFVEAYDPADLQERCHAVASRYTYLREVLSRS